ncbi:hypothetical protein E2562_018183 [Oryza meyeriana var. granulata]|uniref:Uncharacterized protein n=1 Tax=Oryza meyeriana var. granulata TaxID=110450 RepID=A0A6G1C6H3_9ORYZ|nr:hypothetical protein E2562_018183 [Oryza meyeriana var. granulata]KAF0896067.1 hypothetical protein E2562_018183 [Oryza meyeriana var. granulata]KAF0896068.1 hypothetical protein E2562_018183 [Oryza meyeriana var. granulata]
MHGRASRSPPPTVPSLLRHSLSDDPADVEIRVPRGALASTSRRSEIGRRLDSSIPRRRRHHPSPISLLAATASCSASRTNLAADHHRGTASRHLLPLARSRPAPSLIS